MRCRCSFAATLGQGHPKTLSARGNLALTLQKLGEVRRAEGEHQAVLEAKIVQLGSDHADTLITMWALGALLAAANCFARPLGICFSSFLLLLLPLLLLPLLLLYCCCESVRMC